MFKCALLALGCKVNQCETESLARMMRENGFEIVDFSEKADAYIINTCCVTAEGERKSRQMVRRAKALNENCVIAVTGCAAQKDPDEFLKIDGVKIVVGNSHKGELPKMITEKIYESRVDDISHFDVYNELPDAAAEKTRAFIKIQDGCNNFCSYCIIPYVRGRECSRKFESIIEECKKLAENGFKEIVINGIHLSSYGKEWNYKPDLGDVVREICKIDGVERVRLGSLEPNIVTKEFLQKATESQKFCKQYHLSLQSGSDTVLERMNRKYTCNQFEKAVSLIRENYADSAISTDIIVGFPGETEQEFAETLAFAEKIGFAWVHVFPYSVREGTVAAKMDGQIEKSIKAKRAKILAELCKRKSLEYRKRFVGTVQEVLCENNTDGIQTGLTKEHISVEFNSENIENQIVKIKILNASREGLAGERI